MKEWQEWFEIWWLSCIKMVLLCKKIPLNEAKWVNFQIFTVYTGKAFRNFTGDFFKPLLFPSSVHCREGCLKTQSSVAVSVLHNHFCTSPELWVQSGASLKIHQEQFPSNGASKEIFHFMPCDDVLYRFVSCKPSAVPCVKLRKCG